MNTATIRRGTGRGARGGLANDVGRRPRRRKGLLVRLLEALPLDEDQLHKVLTWVLGLVLLALFWLIALFFGLPAMAYGEMSDLAAHAGLQVAKVEVHGTKHMDEQPVYNMALDEVDHSMLALDLAGLRAQIMTLGWVKDARVSRRLPDTLVVDIVERQPVAVWQHDGVLSLVDSTGTVLAGVDPHAIPDMPLVVGPDANHQTEALGKLMDAAPALKPMLAGATWVGNRRWDLKFQSGELLALPEGSAAAAAALIDFARMDGVDHLLGRGIIRFDMRDPSRFVLRLPPGRAPESIAGLQSASTEVPGTELETKSNGSNGGDATSTAETGKGN